ncbi:Gfo/Idh/MocA family protein [Paenibacillus sp. UNC451MF]|uniref:Gfo/Idh/MocA family protein n=1 Tax=Paenibacillus sp. UNC451MF TaxID=1449063 RepID=UPI00048E9959|nr:Gfo/Idh/MocA family oxidoreductase [Paenibacillus sp. UNC451MF]
MKQMNIGIIGLDTSHVVQFTKLLNDPSHEFHVNGGKVAVAFPGGSPDFELSHSRVEGFTTQLSDEFGVSIVDSPEAVAEACDAILLESVDGRVHLDQFRRIASYRKPVYIDKPLTVRADEAQEIVTIAKAEGIPIMSSSALRFAEGMKAAVAQTELGDIIGADCYGPMALQPTQPGYFWYGIHSIEMLYALLGKGCAEISVKANADHDVITAEWQDGRIGTVRGNRKGSSKFGGVAHRVKGSIFVDVYANPKPYYASLLDSIIRLFQTGSADVTIEETLEIIRFIEAANESRATGKSIRLA